MASVSFLSSRHNDDFYEALKKMKEALRCYLITFGSYNYKKDDINYINILLDQYPFLKFLYFNVPKFTLIRGSLFVTPDVNLILEHFTLSLKITTNNKNQQILEKNNVCSFWQSTSICFYPSQYCENLSKFCIFVSQPCHINLSELIRVINNECEIYTFDIIYINNLLSDRNIRKTNIIVCSFDFECNEKCTYFIHLKKKQHFVTLCLTNEYKLFPTNFNEYLKLHQIKTTCYESNNLLIKKQCSFVDLESEYYLNTMISPITVFKNK